MKIVSEYVAPWALVNEDIPIHFIWKPEPSLKTVRVKLPSEFSVVQVLNAEEYSFDPQDNQLSIDCNSLKSNNYFGLIVRSLKKYRKTLVRRPIETSFISHDIVLASRTINATIVRPKLRIAEAPKNLIIDDRVNPRKLFNLTVAHSGLGTAQIKTRVTTHGKIVSSTDSLFLEILKDLFEDVLKQERAEETLEPKSHGFRLDEKWLQATTQEIERYIRKGNIPPEMRREATNRVLQLIENQKTKERVFRLIYTRLRSLLLGALLYYMDRYPEEDIDLPHGGTRTIFRSEVNKLVVRFDYMDSMNNRYSPVRAIINIDDRRTKKDKMFQAPINVRWKREAIEF